MAVWERERQTDATSVLRALSLHDLAALLSNFSTFSKEIGKFEVRMQLLNVFLNVILYILAFILYICYTACICL